MNTMLVKNSVTKSQFLKFADEIKRSGKNPETILNDLISSGKVSKEQVEEAKRKANFYKSFLG